MMHNDKLAKSIQSASWNEFVRQLMYKSDWMGKNVIFIDVIVCHYLTSPFCHLRAYFWILSRIAVMKLNNTAITMIAAKTL